MKSNLSVGMPLDVAIYRNNELKPCFIGRVKEEDDYFHQLRQQWHRGIQELVSGLEPPVIR